MAQSKVLQWTRPATPLFPTVWIEFEAKESKDSDKLVKYRIQDLPENRFDDAVQHLKEYYLRDEPLSVHYDGMNDANFVEEYERLIWRVGLKQNVTLACCRENSDEIVGLSLLLIFTKGDTFLEVLAKEIKSKAFGNLMKMAEICFANFSAYEKYGVDKYMSSWGLSVDPRYRGLDVGTKLLQARAQVAIPFGIEISNSVFTSDYSNASADKAGFQLDVAFTYDELNTINPDLNLINFPSKRYCIKTCIFSKNIHNDSR